jgi:hypothetical protein
MIYSQFNAQWQLDSLLQQLYTSLYTSLNGEWVAVYELEVAVYELEWGVGARAKT